MPDAKPADTRPTQPPAAVAPTAPVPEAPPKAINRTAQIQAIQVLLHELGFYDNTTNGTLGPATRAAIREYQRSNGQPETGEPSQQLLEDLRKKKGQ
jgi:localization factor PodJL